MSDTQLTAWIHPDLLEWVKELVPNDIKKINPHTYEIFGIHFVMSGENITVGDMLIFLRENGWEAENEQEQS